MSTKQSKKNQSSSSRAEPTLEDQIRELESDITDAKAEVTAAPKGSRRERIIARAKKLQDQLKALKREQSARVSAAESDDDDDATFETEEPKQKKRPEGAATVSEIGTSARSRLTRGRAHKSKVTDDAVVARFRKGLFLNVNQSNTGKPHAETLASASAFNDAVLLLNDQHTMHYYIPLLLSGSLDKIVSYIKSHGATTGVSSRRNVIASLCVTPEELCAVGFGSQGAYQALADRAAENGRSLTYPAFDFKKATKAHGNKIATFFQICTNFSGTTTTLKADQLERMQEMDKNDPKMLNYFWTKRKQSKGIVDDDARKKFLMKVMTKFTEVKVYNLKSAEGENSDPLRTINVSFYQGLHKGSSGAAVSPLPSSTTFVVGDAAEEHNPTVDKPHSISFFKETGIFSLVLITTNNKSSVVSFCEDLIEILQQFGLRYFDQSLLEKMAAAGLATDNFRTTATNIINALRDVMNLMDTRLFGELVPKTKNTKDETVGSGIIDAPKMEMRIPINTNAADQPADEEDEGIITGEPEKKTKKTEKKTEKTEKKTEKKKDKKKDETPEDNPLSPFGEESVEESGEESDNESDNEEL